MYTGKGFKSGIIIVLVFIIYFIVTFINQQETLKSKKTALLEIQSDIEMQKIQKIELETEKDMMGSEEYIEKQAREKLGLVKDGEKVYIDSNK
jgi:cell division protein FtsB